MVLYGTSWHGSRLRQVTLSLAVQIRADEVILDSRRHTHPIASGVEANDRRQIRRGVEAGSIGHSVPGGENSRRFDLHRVSPVDTVTYRCCGADAILRQVARVACVCSSALRRIRKDVKPSLVDHPVRSVAAIHWSDRIDARGVGRVGGEGTVCARNSALIG